MAGRSDEGKRFLEGFSRNLRELMDRAHLSGPTDLSAAIPGGKISTVHGWMKGDSQPRADQLAPLSAALHCSILELFLFEETGAAPEVLDLLRALPTMPPEKRASLLRLVHEALALLH